MHENTDYTEKLWAYAQGMPDAELDQHLDSCPECQQELRSLRNLAALRGAGNLPEVPTALTAKLQSLLPKVRPDLVPGPPARPGIAARVRIIVAELLQDTAAQPHLAGLRGETRIRQMAFVSDVADLDLEITPTAENLLIVGQLGMDELPEGLRVVFSPAGQDPANVSDELRRTAIVAEQGHFRVEIESGEWDVSVQIADATVLFRGIDL